MNRLIVCFRLRRVAARTTGGTDLAGDVDELISCAMALGGRVVAWDATAFAFDFSAEAMEDAIELVTGRGVPESVLSAFSVGIAEGEMKEVVDGGAGVVLSLGPGLIRASGLARIARAGEVLVDPLLKAVASGELLTQGSRLGTYGRQRVRGLLVDLLHPWRSGVAVSPSRLARPNLIGREVGEFALEPATLGVVVAGRGQGGSRFLSDFAAQHSAVLHVSPHPIGEPLGALRTALVRSRLGGHTAELAAEQQAALERLLAGEGLVLSDSSALVAAWLGKSAERYVLVDDAGSVDADTLESIAAACRGFGLRVVVRVAEHGEVPAALTDLPRAFEVKLGGLAVDQAAGLAAAYTDG